MAQPHVLNHTTLHLRLNELQSENFSLRSRLQSTLEELRVAQKSTTSSKLVTGRPREASPPGSGDNMRCVPIVDQGTQTQLHIDNALSDKVTALENEVRQKDDRIFQLERQVMVLEDTVQTSVQDAQLHQHHGRSSSTSPSASRPRTTSMIHSPHKLTLENEQLRDRLAHLEKEHRSLNTKYFELSTSVTDANVGDNHEMVALRREYAKAMSDIKQLQRKCDELQSVNSEHHLHPPLSNSRPSNKDSQLAHDVAASALKIKAMFDGYGRHFTADEVERLLKLDAEVAEKERNAVRNGVVATVGTNAEASSLLSKSNHLMNEELEVCRSNLVEAHRKVEELTVALEMHLRYNDLHVSKSAEAAASDSAKQAATEIAFLCDTLAATRAENEMLSRKVSSLVVERDAASAAFEDLKERSVQMLQGCEEVTSSARQDAEATIQAAQGQIRLRERELSLLRGQLLTITRQLEEQTQVKGSLENELVECRTKLLALKDTVTQLRNELKVSKAEKNSVLQSQTAMQKQVHDAQDKVRSLEFQLASQRASSSHDGKATRSRREARILAGSPRRAGSPSTKSPDRGEDGDDAAIEDEDCQDPTSPPQPSPKKSRSKTPSSKSNSSAGRRLNGASHNDMDLLDYKEEYDEFKKCFLVLLPMVPGALTARDVASGLRAGVEKMTVHCKQLEAELRKKLTAHQQLKKELSERQQEIENLTKKANQLDAFEKKLQSKDRLLEKQKKDIQGLKDEEAKLKQRWRDDLEQATGEKEQLYCELRSVRAELAEGKDVLLQLIKESID